MGMAVKLSDGLVTSARAEAAKTDRSIASQIEHWATLGRATEAALPYAEVIALKQAYREPRSTKAPAQKRPK